jgi:hypothetical protein
MQYAYRSIMDYVLFLGNYWLQLNETLWEPSISRGNVLIVAMFGSDLSIQSYGPLIVMIYEIEQLSFPNYFSATTC